MTEHESKEFYDDLRHKLEGYGSAPPESVWEGIRQQVPARPRRWWRSALLAVLLMATVAYFTVGTNSWRPDTNTAGKLAVIRSAEVKAPSMGPKSSRSNVAHINHQATEVEAFYPEKPTVPAAAALEIPSPVTIGAGASQVANSRSAHGSSPVAVTGTAGKKPHTARQLPATDSTAERYTKADAAVAASAGTTQVLAVTRTRRKRRADIPVGIATTGRRHPVQRSLIDFPPKTFASTTTTLSDAVRPEPEAAGSPASAPSSASSSALAATPYSGMQPLLVWLQVPAWPAPQLSYVAVPEKQQPAKPKWALQVLAGPAVSYRKLGANARRVEQLERPAAGYGAQFGVARSINPRLSVSAGIGYAEMATSLFLRVQKADSLPPATVRFRDYYRLLTAPVEAHYLLGNSTRWRYGIQGGVAPALLLSARTTEGGACNCQQQQWQPSDSTQFRRINLTLTAGAFAGYQAAPGLWLTLRPQAQYFLNSITEPTSGRAASHPWSVGVQGGISFDFPSKR